MSDVARLYSESPALRYGLAPRKGFLQEGSDADFVLVDPKAYWEIEDDALLSKAGWSPYTGRSVQGRAIATYLRGEEIAAEGQSHQSRTGQFVPGASAWD